RSCGLFRTRQGAGPVRRGMSPPGLLGCLPTGRLTGHGVAKVRPLLRADRVIERVITRPAVSSSAWLKVPHREPAIVRGLTAAIGVGFGLKRVRVVFRLGDLGTRWRVSAAGPQGLARRDPTGKAPTVSLGRGRAECSPGPPEEVRKRSPGVSAPRCWKFL